MRPLIEPVVERPLVAQFLGAFDGFGRGGGGLLAAGLAFRALFAVLAALLFAVGLLGLLVADPQLRKQLLDTVLVLLPEPLQAPFVDVVTNLVDERWTISILGLLGLLWGAGALYQAVDEAIALLIPGGRPRSGLIRRLRGLLVLAGLIALVALPVSVTLVAPQVAGRVDAILSAGYLSGAFVALVAVIGLLAAAYRWVPVQGPPWRALLPPAVAVGVASWLLTGLFGLIAPLMVRGFAVFGVFVSLLAALIWLNLEATAFLLGAAWTRARRDLRAVADRPPGPPEARPGV
ncbi:MAG: YihY/virulence factor BrkB family protein [Candidatus Limnocylindrales bacterium]